MKRWIVFAVFVAALSVVAAVAVAEEDGTLRVFLILNQRTGPDMRTRVVADIGTTDPVVESWGRHTTLIKKLTPDTYAVSITKAEACGGTDCVPCPDATRTVTITSAEQKDIVIRWRAKYDRVEKKWVCW